MEVKFASSLLNINPSDWLTRTMHACTGFFVVVVLGAFIIRDISCGRNFLRVLSNFFAGYLYQYLSLHSVYLWRRALEFLQDSRSSSRISNGCLGMPSSEKNSESGRRSGDVEEASSRFRRKRKMREITNWKEAMKRFWVHAEVGRGVTLLGGFARGICCGSMGYEEVDVDEEKWEWFRVVAGDLELRARNSIDEAKRSVSEPLLWRWDGPGSQL
ncbi:hypothetical protein BDZ97DRAFT_238706 [Flammula alnicola]|nr:hypothetical protein BDZ97DRAFT_238706 [Flammula alnicola]